MLRGGYNYGFEYDEYEYPPENENNIIIRHPPPPQQFSGSSSTTTITHHCPYHHNHNQHQEQHVAVAVVDDPVYGSDEFRMYGFKIKRCSRTRSHDWTECPFAHRGEKAQRRDPRRFDYCAVACPAFRNGHCGKGSACEFAHGVFEYWLHPGRYRTRACNAGRFCERKVCFFAHTPDQLRAETRYRLHYPLRSRLEEPPPVSDFLNTLRSLNIRDHQTTDHDHDFDLPEIDWVSDLVDPHDHASLSNI